MSDRCHVCGVAAHESQQFIEENIPFMGRRLYCPACHDRLVQRIGLGFAAVIAAIAVLAIFEAARTNEPILNHPGFSMLFLVIVQWFMILPHELGHAIAARLFGYTQIRILIGMGKPLFSFDFAGFYWVFNRVPFGGLTFAEPPAKPHRWNYLIFVGAGLAVNSAVAFAAWLLMGPDGLFHSPGSVAKLFFWANVVVIAENLIPRPVQTSYGNTFTDGWLIWHVLFRWNKPATAGPERIPAWELFVCQILKWSVVLILLIGVLFFAVVAFIPFFDSNAPKIFLGKGLWAVMFIGLALVCGWCCWRVLREPVAKVRKPAVNPGQVADFRAGLTTEQLKMLQNASKLLAEKSYAEASMVLDQLMPATADQSTSAYSQLLLAKVQCLLSLQQIDEAEALCRNYAQREVSSEYKLSVIDGAACFILYQSSSPFLKHAERLARVGLEMAPGALTLKGTLGAILAEQGKHGEAEPLLIECLDRSPTLHDRAIATFYLGMIKMHTGDTKEGKRLARRGMKMYPEDWIVAKGNKLLKEV